ncbi:MAG: ABC transporter substrate-binding protein [Streptosporangiales bacterium]|nr:ABC transporter substrate-binding protein [Streptosporangiales bacterium]
MDDLGLEVAAPPRVRRVVSLVPSLTEAVAVTAPGLLAAATDWCTHPPDLEVVRVRGTKSPDVPKIIELRPDLVLVNFEENREQDLAALRDAGVPVYVTVIRTLPEAFGSLTRMLAACGLDRPRWLDEAREAWADVLATPPSARARAIVPIWRRPWMVLGHGTFAGDVLARLGVANLYGDAAERYPKVPLDELRAAGADLVVLPDEPYAFHAGDGPESFPGLPAALVSGRDLTWYGPSLREARDRLDAALRAPLR